MGLTGLVGGGYPAMDSTATSTTQDHPLGTLANDSSGGQYMYLRSPAGTVTVGQVLVTVAGTLQAVATSSATGGGISTVQGSIVAAACSTGGSSLTYCWAQVHGPATLLGDSTATATATGVNLFVSTTIAGTWSVTTTGARITGAHVLTASSVTTFTGFLNHPAVNTA